MGKVIIRIKGGLGNQLFCYAAARRLALANGAELVIDDVTGFVRDARYRRKYMLDHFNIGARKATPPERMEPFERLRRGLAKWLSRRRPFGARAYLEQEGLEFDPRLLALKVKDTVYLDGYWHSENYFKDREREIREDLRMSPPADAANLRVEAEIRSRASVALHVRLFEATGSAGASDAPADYYRRAVDYMDAKAGRPHYFLFSDMPEEARSRIGLPGDRLTVVSHNRAGDAACADLWLMGRCSHFITANSTFSWWGAWLSDSPGKIVVAPAAGFANDDAVPGTWVKL
ncbi:MAG: alpha-1,2-fucosyltransferase [Elusimicrobia bacterium]|nr:alpha-1,2-fucosyltransferase [Elusimicrobiota bacterium]